MANKVIVPDIGDFEHVEIIEILVKSGDKIKKNDSIVTLESDKSSVEVPSTTEGMVENINVKIGDKVSKGDVLISLSGGTVKAEDEKIKSSKDKLPVDTEKIIQQLLDERSEAMGFENISKNKLVSIKLISYDDCMDKFSQSLACDLSELRQIIDFLDCIEYKGMNYAEINEFKGLLSIKFRNLFNNSFKVYGVVLFSLYFELCSCGKYDMRGGYFFMSLIKSYTVFRVKKYLSYFLNKPV